MERDDQVKQGQGAGGVRCSEWNVEGKLVSPRVFDNQEAINARREDAKSTRRLPQSRTQAKGPRYDISGERGEAPGRYHLVRQFLPVASPRCAVTAGLQARHLHYYARRAHPAVRPRASGGRLT